MIDHSVEFKRCLLECDVVSIRKLWGHIAPNLHQPATDHEAEATIHRARTEMPSMRFRLRAYSHRWLVDNGYPSALPDKLRPRAERIYPRIVDAVGISVNTHSSLFRPAAKLIHKAMIDAVMEAYLDNKTEPSFVKKRMNDARTREMNKLFGNHG